MKLFSGRQFILGTMALLAAASANSQSIDIPIGGNTWRHSPAPTNETRSAKSGDEDQDPQIGKTGITKWSDAATSFTTWCRFAGTGTIRLQLHFSVPAGQSRIGINLQHGPGDQDQASVNNPGPKTRKIDLKGAGPQTIDAGAWEITDTGYYAITITGLSKTGPVFADIQSITVTPISYKGAMNYTPNDEGNFFYWGRRGPSVHLNYDLADNIQAKWFYNEVTVPKGQDVLGSYFMANGFGQGYFGMQVNSATERHILFSVWSPFHTDDPHAIPDSQKIILVRKGEGVHAGEFGSEGSGGQSYLNYPWKAGNTYRFLLEAQPLDNQKTRFTAWFYAPEEGHWRLIASFSRPQTHSWLTHLHSFLENFIPGQGYIQRSVEFNHQWIMDTTGKWIPLTKARFSADNTARKGYRMDYQGGGRNGAFYLQNCGFFDHYTPIGSQWTRPAETGSGPSETDLEQLP